MVFPNRSYDEVLWYILATGIAPIAININNSGDSASTWKMSSLSCYLLLRVNKNTWENWTLKQHVQWQQKSATRVKAWTGASGASNQPARCIVCCRNCSCSRLWPLDFLRATVLCRIGCCSLCGSKFRGAPQRSECESTVFWTHFIRINQENSWLIPAKILLIYSGRAGLNPKHRMGVSENTTTSSHVLSPHCVPDN